MYQCKTFTCKNNDYERNKLIKDKLLAIETSVNNREQLNDTVVKRQQNVIFNNQFLQKNVHNQSII